MRLWGLAAAAIVIGGGGYYFLGEREHEPDHHTQHSASEIANGLSGYQANCSVCHGNEGVGTTKGPPLVHIIYEPGHHADVTFQRAVKYGVRQHHWRFGNMPCCATNKVRA